MIIAIDPFWNDFLAVGGFVVGVLGMLVGILGFWYTIIQVRKTKAAAIAAEEAANEVLNERRNSFRKLVAASAHRYLNEANHYLQESD